MVMFDYKQCIVVTKDVDMTCPKLCVQIAHASIESYRLSQKRIREMWYQEGQKKVVLALDTTEELIALATKAETMGIGYAIIQDLGYTEIEPDTTTAVGFEILPNETIDNLTGNLKVLRRE
jgi:PTH2 family peptidyl-tRNA hydrolase